MPHYFAPELMQDWHPIPTNMGSSLNMPVVQGPCCPSVQPVQNWIPMSCNQVGLFNNPSAFDLGMHSYTPPPPPLALTPWDVGIDGALEDLPFLAGQMNAQRSVADSWLYVLGLEEAGLDEPGHFSH